MITVVNCHWQTPDVYCGRAWKGYKASCLGNPFRVGDARGNAIERYRRWLWQKIKARDLPVCCQLLLILARHAKGQEVRLGCWCAPKPCHCEVIIAALESTEVCTILNEVLEYVKSLPRPS